MLTAETRNVCWFSKICFYVNLTIYWQINSVTLVKMQVFRIGTLSTILNVAILANIFYWPRKSTLSDVISIYLLVFLLSFTIVECYLSQGAVCLEPDWLECELDSNVTILLTRMDCSMSFEKGEIKFTSSFSLWKRISIWVINFPNIFT